VIRARWPARFLELLLSLFAGLALFLAAVGIHGVLSYQVAALVAGFVLTALLARMLSGLLFGVAPTDKMTQGIVAVMLSAVATLAAWLPARRAVAVDPLLALRE
jgi:ABC-type lipoprotein release transport system permease subunit